MKLPSFFFTALSNLHGSITSDVIRSENTGFRYLKFTPDISLICDFDCPLGPFVKLLGDLWCNGVVPFWKQVGELQG
jgi:hypothetical protein